MPVEAVEKERQRAEGRRELVSLKIETNPNLEPLNL